MNDSGDQWVVKVDASIVCVRCDLDMSTASAVTREILSVPGDVTVDLSDVPFMDSAGLRSLLIASQTVRARPAEIRFVNAPQPVLRLLEIIGTASALGIRLPEF